MIQELLYTSHEGRGLRKGSGGGFCTVLSTDGMMPNLALALEKLSGYKHPFDMHDPRSKSNPVNYRHATLRIGGKTFHVLSRVADYGKEHTGRTNKLAHHLVLPTSMLVPGGPTAILDSQLMRADWDAEVRLVPPVPGSQLNRQDLVLESCHHWKAMAGDAGWAGMVANHLLESRDQPIHIIFPINVDVLPLVTEVLSLLPSKRRWETTFSTFFTSLPAGISSQLRFVLDGTEEAEDLRRDHRQVVVDLTSKLDSPPENEWVTIARTGVLPARIQPTVNAPVTSTSPDIWESNEADPVEYQVSVQSTPPAFYEYGERELKLAPPERRPPDRRTSRESRGGNSNNGTRGKWMAVAAVVLLLLLFSSSALLIWNVFPQLNTASKKANQDNQVIGIENTIPEDLATTEKLDKAEKQDQNDNQTPVLTAAERVVDEDEIPRKPVNRDEHVQTQELKTQDQQRTTDELDTTNDKRRTEEQETGDEQPEDDDHKELSLETINLPIGGNRPFDIGVRRVEGQEVNLKILGLDSEYTQTGDDGKIAVMHDGKVLLSFELNEDNSIILDCENANTSFVEKLKWCTLRITSSSEIRLIRLYGPETVPFNKSLNNTLSEANELFNLFDANLETLDLIIDTPSRSDNFGRITYREIDPTESKLPIIGIYYKRKNDEEVRIGTLEITTNKEGGLRAKWNWRMPDESQTSDENDALRKWKGIAEGLRQKFDSVEAEKFWQKSGRQVSSDANAISIYYFENFPFEEPKLQEVVSSLAWRSFSNDWDKAALAKKLREFERTILKDATLVFNNLEANDQEHGLTKILIFKDE